jgi:hypothetical protein
MGGVRIWIHSFLTSAPDGGEGTTLRPGRFTPEKELWCPFNRRLGGPHSRAGRFGKQEHLLSLAEFEPRTVQPVVQADLHTTVAAQL